MAQIEPTPAICILGARVHMVEIPEVVSIMGRWIQSERGQFHQLVNTGMHGIMEAHRDHTFKTIVNSSALFVPDGILVSVIARLKGYRIRKSKTGPELMLEFCRAYRDRGYKHYFYGDTQETLEQLTDTLRDTFPDIRIAGLYSPPFRALTPEEDEAIVQEINQAAPDVLWVGLGTPKQDKWIYQHRDKLMVPVVVGAGASLKFTSGMVKRAPSWLRNSGFEWLWRMITEPARVWRRVLLDAPRFIGLVALEMSGLKKYR